MPPPTAASSTAVAQPAACGVCSGPIDCMPNSAQHASSRLSRPATARLAGVALAGIGGKPSRCGAGWAWGVACSGMRTSAMAVLRGCLAA